MPGGSPCGKPAGAAVTVPGETGSPDVRADLDTVETEGWVMSAELMDSMRQLLGWCTLINFALLTVWFAAFVLARDGMQRLHGRWFSLTPEHFNVIHYCGMAIYKLGILLFNAVPYLVLRIAF
jgi:hypothetical protein